MATWIALLRGINVLGRRIVPMNVLSTSLERDGLQRVRTYIQSGNVIFQCARGTPGSLARRIGGIVLDAHGFEPSVVVLSVAELVRAAADNPFPAAAAAPQTLHLYFLEAEPRAPDLEALKRARSAREAFHLRGKVFYLHTPQGFAASKLRNDVERRLGVQATARNWRTVNKLIDLAGRSG